MATVYNRPATVEAVYGDVVRVRFEDTHMIGYVSVDDMSGSVPSEVEGGRGDE